MVLPFNACWALFMTFRESLGKFRDGTNLLGTPATRLMRSRRSVSSKGGERENRYNHSHDASLHQASWCYRSTALFIAFRECRGKFRADNKFRPRFFGVFWIRRRRGSALEQQLHAKTHHHCWNVCTPRRRLARKPPTQMENKLN